MALALFMEITGVVIFLYLKDKITGILDWEMAHIGDPLEDLAGIVTDMELAR